MTRGRWISKAAILLARRIGGAERDEWVRAMAAEWDALERGKSAWALGCLGAALRDRLWRERRFLAAIIVAIPATLAWSSGFMTAVAPVLRDHDAATILWIAAYLINPVVIPFALGLLYPRRATAIGFVAGLAWVFTPFLISMAISTLPPTELLRLVLRDFGSSLVMHPVALAAWTGAARLGGWLGSRSMRCA